MTRAVRIIDLVTNMCTQSFENHSGLKVFIERLEVIIHVSVAYMVQLLYLGVFLVVLHRVVL